MSLHWCRVGRAGGHPAGPRQRARGAAVKSSSAGCQLSRSAPGREVGLPSVGRSVGTVGRQALVPAAGQAIGAVGVVPQHRCCHRRCWGLGAGSAAEPHPGAYLGAAFADVPPRITNKMFRGSHLGAPLFRRPPQTPTRNPHWRCPQVAHRKCRGRNPPTPDPSCPRALGSCCRAV